MNNVIKALILLMFYQNLFSNECFDRAWKNYNNQKYQSSINDIKSCLDNIISHNDPKLIDYAFSGLANNFIKLGEIDSALKYILVSYDIEKKYDINQTKTLNEIGTIYIEKGLNHQALYYFKKALDLNRKDNSYVGMSINFSNIGFAFTNLQMVDSAKVYFNKALNLEKKNLKIDPMLLNNIAYSLFQNKDYSNSLSYLKKSYNLLNSKNSKLDKYIIGTNLELVKLFNKESINNSIFDKYLEYSKMLDNSIYYADANYKKSIIESSNKKHEKSIKYLNIANSIYVQFGNISKAKEITKLFLLVNHGNYSSQLKYPIVQLTELLNIEYSKQLENEIEAKVFSDLYIAKIENDLYYSKISLYLSLSLLFSLILSIVFIYYKIKTNKTIFKIISGYSNYIELIYQIDSQRLRLNLSKITNYMVLDKSFKDKKIFTDLIDEVVTDTNKIRKTANSGINFQQTLRYKNVRLTTTNKLPMDW